eukprot:Pgem_evm1s9043
MDSDESNADKLNEHDDDKDHGYNVDDHNEQTEFVKRRKSKMFESLSLELQT